MMKRSCIDGLVFVVTEEIERVKILGKKWCGTSNIDHSPPHPGCQFAVMDVNYVGPSDHKLSSECNYNCTLRRGEICGNHKGFSPQSLGEHQDGVENGTQQENGQMKLIPMNFGLILLILCIWFSY